MWLPYNGKENHIQVNKKAHMKHMVTKSEGRNETISFSHSILGNHFLEADHDI
jgi:hypothetical protein